jgi:hypothetical protein
MGPSFVVFDQRILACTSGPKKNWTAEAFMSGPCYFLISEKTSSNFLSLGMITARQ